MTDVYTKICPKCKGKQGHKKHIACGKCESKGEISNMLCPACLGKKQISIYVACNNCHGMGFTYEFY